MKPNWAELLPGFQKVAEIKTMLAGEPPRYHRAGNLQARRTLRSKKSGQLNGKNLIHYDRDTYECPAGKYLYPRSFDKIRWATQ